MSLFFGLFVCLLGGFVCLDTMVEDNWLVIIFTVFW